MPPDVMMRLALGHGTSADVVVLRDTILEIVMKKLGAKHCDLWSDLRNRGYKDKEIERHLWQERPRQPGPPHLAWYYAERITTDLLRDGCECYERYHGDDGSSRKYNAMKAAHD